MNNKYFSHKISIFHGIKAPEEGMLVGYGALIEAYSLAIPLPDNLVLISTKNRKYTTDQWQVLTPRHQPKDTLYDQLVFALKYEGVNLIFFKKLFEQLTEEAISNLVQIEPQGQYSRRIWFLYEWLMSKKLPILDLDKGNFVLLIDEDLQYASIVTINSTRHRVKNNLPGTVDFCPLIKKTKKLEAYLAKNTTENINKIIKGIHKDVLLRTSSFLMLKDSKASFNIEGENPTQTRAFRWGKAIGQAGNKPLSKEELYRLQQIVIEKSKFVSMGYRTKGGFVGEHDRITGEPIPEHISARWEDVESLMSGLISASEQMEKIGFHPILTATKIAFGFVFIHPFVDGNGRLHRYLIHHLLSAMKFSPQGMIFPVSAAILERMEDYAKVLESYSHPLLEFVEWEKTNDNNVKILNETADYYRYFDATKQAEFLCECIDTTIHKIIPTEAAYLQKYDAMKLWLDNAYEMPDNIVALLIRFLEQNNGSLSKRAKEKDFGLLTEEEVGEIEKKYHIYFSTSG
jgi:hypothetical protein